GRARHHGPRAHWQAGQRQPDSTRSDRELRSGSAPGLRNCPPFGSGPASSHWSHAVGHGGGCAVRDQADEVAGQDVGTAGTLLVLLLPSTVLYLPLVAPLVLPNVAVTITAIAIPLLLS